MKGLNMKSITILYFTFISLICYASESEDGIAHIITEPVELVLVCPEGSKHEGEELPTWVTTEEATKFYCNELVEDSEIAE
jgi:hypothetical protein